MISPLRFLPDEWVSASKAFKAMWSSASQTPLAKTKIIVGILVPALAGYGLYGWFGVPLSVDFLQGVLAVLGVFFGFVVTLMMFTGNIDGTDVLTHQQSVWFAQKSFYLFFSQALTLLVYLGTLTLGAIWLLLSKGDPTGTALRALTPYVYAAILLCLVRTILLPAQIFERHQFVIETMVEIKLSKENADIEKQHRALEDFKAHRG